MADPAPKARPIGWLVLPVRVLLGALFVVAGYLKISDPQSFAFAVKGFKILPDHLIVPTAFALPWIEVLAGILLIIGLWTRGGAVVIFLMLLGFTAGQVSVIERGLDVKCSCFGNLEWPCGGAVGTCHLIRNAVLMLMALIAATLGPGPLAIDRHPQR